MRVRFPLDSIVESTFMTDITNFLPTIQITAHVWDKKGKLYYKYRLGIIDRNDIDRCVEDFRKFAHEALESIEKNISREEFLKMREEYWEL